MTSGFSEPFHVSPSRKEASHRYLSRRNLSASAAFGSVLKGGSYANSDHVGSRWWYIVPHGWCIGSASYRAKQCDGAENRLVLRTRVSTAPLLAATTGRTARGVAGEPLISSPLLLRQSILSRLLSQRICRRSPRVSSLCSAEWVASRVGGDWFPAPPYPIWKLPAFKAPTGTPAQLICPDAQSRRYRRPGGGSRRPGIRRHPLFRSSLRGPASDPRWCWCRHGLRPRPATAPHDRPAAMVSRRGRAAFRGRVIWDDNGVGVCDQEKARSEKGALLVNGETRVACADFCRVANHLLCR